jgi:hypothetical protein
LPLPTLPKLKAPMKKYILLLTYTFSFLFYNQSSATTIFVNQAALGMNSGNSWANAYADLNDALTSAILGDTIWVAKGTYYPTSTLDKNSSFVLKNGVKIFGGFMGTETSLQQRDWMANQTILSGDIGMVGDSTDNIFTILYMEQVDASTKVDGFYFLYGNANDPNGGYDQPSTCGGAIYINGKDGIAYPKIHNCIFMYNHSLYSGGAVYVNGSGLGSVAPQFYNCHFEMNHADYDGGAISRYGGSWDGMANDFWHCKFVKNISGHHGGGIFYFETERLDTIEFIGCEFIENEANNIGDAVAYLGGRETGSKQILDSCLFENNLIINNSDGYRYYANNFLYSDLLVLKNCIFSNSIFFADDFSLDFFSSKYIFDNNLFKFGSLFFGASLDTVEIRNSTFDKYKLWFGFTHDCVNIKSCSFSNSSNASYIAGGRSVNISNSTFENIDTIFLRKVSGFRTNISITNSTLSNNHDKINQEINPNFPYNYRYSYKIHNSIFSNNSEYPLPFEADTFYIENSIIDTSGCENLTPRTITCGPAMLYNLDPLFLDTAAGDFRLSPCSPARNAGSNAIVDSLGILTDIDGAPRIQGGTVDMGAYESPAFQASSATVLSPSCGTGGMASISLDLEHACPPFFLDWGSGTAIADTSPALLLLPVGSHSVTVTDGRMESDTIALQISAAPAPTASLGALPVQCPSGAGPSIGGTASIEATGGTGPFSYLWSNGSATPTINGLPAGPTGASTYTVTLTDANGCTLTDSVSVGTAGSLALGLSVHPVTCAGDSDGWATVQPTGGTMPFQWLWQNGLSTPTIDSLPGGTYLVTVTDALGCTGATNFTMNPPTAVMVSISAMNPLCFGGLGSATATATDAMGCTGTDTVNIAEPPQLAFTLDLEPPVLCHGDSNGTFTVIPTGGTPPYTWAGQTENISAGSYAFTVTDANGCTRVKVTQVSDNPEITVTDTVANASSPTAADGSITLTSVTGGTGSGFTFSWSPTGAGNVISTEQNLTNVPTGDYTLTVTDSQGCTASFSFFVDFNSAAGEAGANPFGAAIVPNPSGSGGARLVLERPLAQFSVRVFDAQGRLVHEQRADLALPKDLAAGTYQVVLERESKRAVLKWVVGE